MTDKKKDYNIFGGDRFIESMRSGGYKDTSYAIGEIVDNAIDAKAKHVEIICQDAYNVSTGRYSLTEIAILDDGQGMTAQELRSALLFGDGTRGSDPNEIGKYGMGLPNSSLSQCKRVEVYSWQNGSDPICSYIDVDEVKLGKKEGSRATAKRDAICLEKNSTEFFKKIWHAGRVEQTRQVFLDNIKEDHGTLPVFNWKNLQAISDKKNHHDTDDKDPR